MDKTFKSADLHNRELKVDVLFGSPRLIITDFDGDNKGFIFEKADAPALALETLEKAGFKEDPDPMNHFELAMFHLKEGLKAQERAKAEAKAQAELEAEALELINAWMESCGAGKYPSWGHVETSRRKQGLAVALKARELAKQLELGENND